VKTAKGLWDLTKKRFLVSNPVWATSSDSAHRTVGCRALCQGKKLGSVEGGGGFTEGVRTSLLKVFRWGGLRSSPYFDVLTHRCAVLVKSQGYPGGYRDKAALNASIRKKRPLGRCKRFFYRSGRYVMAGKKVKVRNRLRSSYTGRTFWTRSRHHHLGSIKEVGRAGRRSTNISWSARPGNKSAGHDDEGKKTEVKRIKEEN